MSSILDIPEVAALDARRSLIRIPPEIDVPLTRRVRQVIDTADFRRLARISQLGLVSLVYPAAHHTRFEHSLGVFRLGLLYLKRLAHDERFQAAVSPENAEIFLAAALLHDLGHWPFCHPIEDIELPGVPSHELFANSFLLEGEIGDVLRHDWNVQPREVVALLSEKPRDAASRILASMLSGPIDIDKMDYLFRDSLHAGVPYGRHFDQQRLLGQPLPESRRRRPGDRRQGPHGRRVDGLCPLRDVQRGLLAPRRPRGHGHVPAGVLSAARRAGPGRLVPPLGARVRGRVAARGRHGPGRRPAPRTVRSHAAALQAAGAVRLFRRARNFTSGWPGGPIPGWRPVASILPRWPARALGRVVAPHEILFDAPPVSREVQISIEIQFPKEGTWRGLAEVSPVVRALATEQFDDYVKRVRIYAHPRLVGDLRRLPNLPQLLDQAIERTGQ